MKRKRENLYVIHQIIFFINILCTSNIKITFFMELIFYAINNGITFATEIINLPRGRGGEGGIIGGEN